MVVIAATQFYWTGGIEAGLNENGYEGVKAYYETVLGRLQELSYLVRTPLTKLQNKVLSALIVMEVHARDVVERLIEAEVSLTSDFEWVSQLRYYWEGTTRPRPSSRTGARARSSATRT
jgi:dynein heavy chain